MTEHQTLVDRAEKHQQTKADECIVDCIVLPTALRDNVIDSLDPWHVHGLIGAEDSAGQKARDRASSDAHSACARALYAAAESFAAGGSIVKVTAAAQTVKTLLAATNYDRELVGLALYSGGLPLLNAISSGQSQQMNRLLQHEPCSTKELVHAACSFGIPRALWCLRNEPSVTKTGDDDDGDVIDRPWCLAAACRGGHVGIIKMLDRQPFSLGEYYRQHEMVFAPVLAIACAAGRPESVAALAAPQYGLCHDDVVASRYAAAISAVESGCPSVVEALTHSPYSLDYDDVIDANLLPIACAPGRCRVLSVLGKRPLSLNGGDARMRGALESAAQNNSAEAIGLLARPPFSLGRDDAVQCKALFVAASCGAVKAIEALALPPYSMSGEDAMACGALAEACKGDAWLSVAALARHPYLLGADAAKRCAALAVAVRRASTRAAVVLMLPPYSLGTDAESCSILAEAAASPSANAEIIALSRSPNDPSAWPDSLTEQVCVANVQTSQ